MELPPFGVRRSAFGVCAPKGYRRWRAARCTPNHERQQ